MSIPAPPDGFGLAHWLQERAVRAPDRVALVEQRDVTYGELWRRVLDLAQTLTALGLGPGDRVAIALENSSAYVIAYYAAFAAGCVPVALNPAGKACELGRCIQHSGARVLVTRAENAELPALTASSAGIALLLAGGERLPGAFRLGTSATTLKAPPSHALMRGVSRDALAALVYTSGTTAEPKAVMLSHGNLVANVDGIVRSLALSCEERCLSVLPFFYAYGASVLHTHLAVGATLVIEERLGYPARLIARIAEQRVSSLPLVPSMLPLLFRSGKLCSVDLSSLRRITLAGGACREREVMKLRALLPHVEVFLMYGQTEATARLCCSAARYLEQRPEAVGQAIPGVTLEIRNGAGEPAAPGEVGEVFARGPNVMLGYLGDPRATAAVLSGGWLRTGDVGSLDRDGFLSLKGRRTDIIKTGAHRVDPNEVEEVLAQLEGVEGSVVVGAPDEVLGEAVIAYIQRASGSDVTAEAVFLHCRRRLSIHKVPRRIQFVSELSTTASGKVLRRAVVG
jgi:long-chain acyl-CoA synthetase